MVERVGLYREGIRQAKPVGSFVNNQIAALCVTHCAENDEEPRTVAGPEGAWFVHMAENLYAPWQGRKVPDSYKFAVSAIQQERTGKTFADHIQSGAFAMGNPDTVIKVLQKYEEAGVDQILCFMRMGNLAHTRIMDSIRLFGRHVIPAFPSLVHTGKLGFCRDVPWRMAAAGKLATQPRFACSVIVLTLLNHYNNGHLAL